MARKKKNQPVEEPRKYSKADLEAALNIAHTEYFMQVVSLLSMDPEVKNMTFVRVPITTPDGGTYLLSILHVDGPKLDLQRLAEASEIDEKEKPQP